MLDEVRLYSRALTLAEIQADRTTPITPPGPDTTPPSDVTGLTATAVSPTQITLSWTAATDNIGVTGYRVERCQGVGCASFVQIATPAGTTFGDTSLTAATSYSYRVKAVDAAINLSVNYSNVASAIIDATPPSDVTGLTATAVSATQITLSWTAATDDIGVTGYRVERCQGVGCASFVQIATPAGTTFGDTSLTAATSYSYRVKAVDAATNLSVNYSNVASAITPAASSDTTPPGVTNQTPLSGATGVAAGTTVTATFSETLDPTTITAATFELRDSTNVLVPATVMYNGTTFLATLTPGTLATGTIYTATLRGGTVDPRVKDIAGNALTANVTWSFTTTSNVTAGFTQSTIYSGLTEPVAVRFSQDGRVFVAEKSGLIKVFDSLANTTPAIFADLRTNVHNFWDRGLLGITLHPDFPTIPYIYVLYAYDKDPNNPQIPRWGTPGATSDGCPDPPGATTNGCVISGRLSRLEAAGNLSTGPEVVLVEGWGQQFPSHSIGNLAFGADGALYASAGEGASFNSIDYGQKGNPLNPLGDPPVGVGGVQTPPTAEGGALRSQSLRRVSGPAVLNGTIIRVDPATGEAMPDNPLIANPDLNARSIVGYGLRNPFRFTIRPGTNEVWIGDVGYNVWEEINRIADPKSPTVTNFGWPCYEGNGRQSGYDAANLNICVNLYAQAGAVTAPYFTYDHNQLVVAGESCPIGSSSITGLAFYNGGNYPANYSGALFFADYSRNCIWVMFKGINGLPDPATRVTFLAGAVNPVDLQVGPNGDLFYVDFHPGVTGGGTVLRLQYSSGSNNPPVAVMSATPLFGATPLTVNFNGTGSSDPDAGDTLAYSWDLNGDGVFGDASTATASYTYTTAGNYTAKLRVTDSRGTSNETTKLIAAGNTPPTAIIDTPLTGTKWQVGQTVNFAGHATDLEQGTLPAAALSWSINLLHCPSNCHTHSIQAFPGVASGSFPAPDHDYPSQIEIVFTVTDAGGLQDSQRIILDPNTAALTFQTSPTGLQLVVGSAASATPFSRTVIVGSSNSVSATTPQTQGATTYVFSSWSDGGAQSHNIVAGSSPATYTATYIATTDTTAPTVAMTAPAEGASVAGSITVSANATDNVGGTGLAAVQFLLDGANLGAEDTTAPYSITWNSFGTTNGPHTLSARARDVAGNSATSTVVNVTVANIVDTTRPTDPTSLGATAAGSSQINLAWTASTDSGGSGLAGYRIERCTGASCSSFGQIATPVQNSYSDTGLLAGTSYSYRVQAVDGANNVSLNYSNVASVTTQAATGLITAYGMNEGSGTTLTDASGNGHTGTLVNGPAWVTSQATYGQALSFDGVNDAVSVANPATYNFGTADFTIEMWVKRNVLGGSQRHLFSKCAPTWVTGCKEFYFSPSNQLTFGSFGTGDTFAGTIADTNWHHVAVTFTDATNLLNLYVDGVLRTTATKALEADGASHVVTVGNHQGSNPFSGVLDEVRIYSRVLTLAEIQADRTTPIVP